MKHSLFLLAALALRAQAQIPPDTLKVIYGKVQLGDLHSLAADDLNPFRICKFFVPNQASPIVRFECTANTGYPSCSEYIARTKAQTLTAGSFALDVEGFNYDTNAYGQAHRVTLGTNYGLNTLDIVNGASSYLSLDGFVRARLSVWQTGPSSALLPCSGFEYLNWFLTP